MSSSALLPGLSCSELSGLSGIANLAFRVDLLLESMGGRLPVVISHAASAAGLDGVSAKNAVELAIACAAAAETSLQSCVQDLREGHMADGKSAPCFAAKGGQDRAYPPFEATWGLPNVGKYLVA